MKIATALGGYFILVFLRGFAPRLSSRPKAIRMRVDTTRENKMKTTRPGTLLAALLMKVYWRQFSNGQTGWSDTSDSGPNRPLFNARAIRKF
jgi:hypothetical protein